MRKKGLLEYLPEDVTSRHDLWLIKNANNQITSTTDFHANILGFKNSDAIAGKTAFEIKAPSVDLAPLFHQQTIDVIQNRQLLEFINLNVFANDQLSCLFTSKSPIIDQSNNTIGCEIISREIGLTHLPPFVKALHKHAGRFQDQFKQVSYRIVDSYSSQGLSARESEVLFLLCFGYTAAGIADMLYVSRRTVETHLDKIKYKLNIHSKTELLHYAIFSGINTKVPRGILRYKA